MQMARCAMWAPMVHPGSVGAGRVVAVVVHGWFRGRTRQREQWAGQFEGTRG